MKYNRRATLRFAFKQSLPVLFGYLFLGAAFGIMLFKAGYNWVWAALISLLVYAGSGQFLLVSLISSGAGLATTALMTLFINTRHMFYGLSYIEKFKAGGWRYPFMIFTLTDETYSVNASILSVPDGVDEPRARFLIGELDHVYWIIGSVLGSLLSAALPMDFTGIDFSMTALFVVIFIDLIRNQKGRAGLIGALGLCAGILCLLIFGADKFLLPSLVLTVAVLSAGRPSLIRNGGLPNDQHPFADHGAGGRRLYLCHPPVSLCPVWGQKAGAQVRSVPGQCAAGSDPGHSHRLLS